MKTDITQPKDNKTHTGIRCQFILDWIETEGCLAELDGEFHEEFAKRFNLQHQLTLFGPAVCEQAAADLDWLEEKGIIERYGFSIFGRFVGHAYRMV